MQQNVEQACPYDPFCLGMCEWTGCIGAKVNVKLHLPTTSTSEPHLPDESERFDFVDEDTLEEFSKGLVLANTARSTKWALKVFELWREQRNERFPGDKIPEDFLCTVDSGVLNTHLS